MNPDHRKLFCLGCLLLVVLLSSGEAADRDDSSSEDHLDSDSESDYSDDPTWTPPPGAMRDIPHIFFLDVDDVDYVDMDDIFDADMETGDMMIVFPSNWTDLTLGDVNDAVEACRDARCRRYQACILSDDYSATCQCPNQTLCENVDNEAICAGNGQTYDNRCLLRVDECAANRLLRVLHRGPCRQSATARRRR